MAENYRPLMKNIHGLRVRIYTNFGRISDEVGRGIPRKWETGTGRERENNETLNQLDRIAFYKCTTSLNRNVTQHYYIFGCKCRKWPPQSLHHHHRHNDFNISVESLNIVLGSRLLNQIQLVPSIPIRRRMRVCAMLIKMININNFVWVRSRCHFQM